MFSMLLQRSCILSLLLLTPVRITRAADDGLVGYWKLQGDSWDYSEKRSDGQNHNVDLSTSSFNGRDAYIEVKSSKSLRLGAADFSITADVYTDKDVRGAFGTLVSKF